MEQKLSLTFKRAAYHSKSFLKNDDSITARKIKRKKEKKVQGRKKSPWLQRI